MTKSIFLNLAVADVARAATFYEALGFIRDEAIGNDQVAAMIWSDQVTVMLMSRAFYANLVPNKALIDASNSIEVVIGLNFDSRAGVDAIVERAVAAGSAGDINEPDDYGFMYGRSFEDLDGHAFAPTWFDREAMLAAHAQAA